MREIQGVTPEDGVGAVLVLEIAEEHIPNEGIVEVVEVTDDEPDHWAWSFNTRTYTLSDIRRLIVEDQQRRRRGRS